MIDRAKNRAGWILLVIFVVITGVWFFFSDLKIQLFDLPALEAKRQAVIPILSALTANDALVEESHYPLRKAPFCLWGADFWTYKSSRTWSELIRIFNLSFVSWTSWSKMSSNSNPYDYYSITYYHNDPLAVGIEWKSDDLNVGNIYIVRLYIDEPSTPQCGPD